MPLVIVSLIRSEEVKAIYSLTGLIGVEAKRATKGPMQYGNCQDFGLTKVACRPQAACVRCGQQHWSSNYLEKDPSLIRAKFVNCNGNHTATYWGCPYYKDLPNIMKKKTYAAAIRKDMNPSDSTDVSTNAEPSRKEVENSAEPSRYDSLRARKALLKEKRKPQSNTRKSAITPKQTDNRPDIDTIIENFQKVSIPQIMAKLVETLRSNGF